MSKQMEQLPAKPERPWASPTVIILLTGLVIVIILIGLTWLGKRWGLGPHMHPFVVAAGLCLSISGLIGILAFLLYYHGLFPHLIVTVQVDELLGRVLRVRLKVENKSDVVAWKLWARFQILDHVVNNQTDWLLSPDRRKPTVSGKVSFAPTEWVPIYKSGLDYANKGEEPLGGLKDYVEVMNSTIAFEPNEIISTDLLYVPAKDATAVHCALQIKIWVDWFVRIIHRIMMGREYSPSFTTTVWAPVSTLDSSLPRTTS
jgi:hypothetical protein